MDRHEARLREFFLSTPSEKWPEFAKAMAWERGTAGPPWMDADERDWFWRTIDYETEKAAKQAEWDAAVAQLKAAFLEPWVRLVEKLTARLR